MALSKIQAESMNLADTFAFTGTVSGGGMDLLYAVTSSSSVSSHDISSTYINSTYDNYYLVGYFEGDGDTKYLQGRVFVGGTVQTGTIYGHENQRVGGAYSSGGSNNNSENYLFSANTAGFGGEDGEGISVSMVFQNANNTQSPFCCTGLCSWAFTDAVHNASTFSGSLKVANRADVVNGLSLMMHSGNTTYAKFKLYGLRD